MPLHPEVSAFLELLAATGLRPVNELPVPEARERMRAGVALFGGDTEPVASVDDRTLPGPAGPIPIRVYNPAPEAGPLPILAYFHGGGWVVCDLDTHDNPCRVLANRSGCIVVSVDYRLAPEHPFPAAIEDAWAATTWLADHGDDVGGDPARLAVGGDSAGGNLAAAVAIRARDAQAPNLAFQLLVYPVTDHEFESQSYIDNAQGYYLTVDSMRWYWGHYLEDESHGAAVDASPLRASDLSGLPPALIITAEYDPLRDQGEAYGRRLQEAGGRATVSRYDGMIHGFWNLAGPISHARAAHLEAAETLARELDVVDLSPR
jgi:acetyl esterase